jgi:pyruvate/2-oxoglutarate/acetoin dehydrogenase E1 component/TPP-dependent pyruvate/acetoin dehydrogenase alpha subunit
MTEAKLQKNEEDFRQEILNDYRIACESRQASLLGRKEVLTGKAKFGIFGDGKEIAQIALSKAFQKGDIRSGYYRDQTLMFALGMSSVFEFFTQLYAVTDVNLEPASAGRMMNGHFGTRFLNADGSFKNLTEDYHSTIDISPTAGQMGRSLGIAYASKLYRNLPELNKFTQFSKQGNEVSFVTIGNASASEGHFWETINAAGVLQVPLAVNVWDDGYGISVPAKYQTTKENMGEILAGFNSTKEKPGVDIYTARGWDYPALVQMYQKGVDKIRTTHTPAVFHITEVTQPQGHSTSGSHERYKSKERLEWEAEFDGIAQMKKWMLEVQLANENELEEIEQAAIETVKKAQKDAWAAFRKTVDEPLKEAVTLIQQLADSTPKKDLVSANAQSLYTTIDPIQKDIFNAVRKSLFQTRGENTPQRGALEAWLEERNAIMLDKFSSKLYSDTSESPLLVNEVKPEFSSNSPTLNGYEILNKAFDHYLEKHPNFFAIGEDVGKIGDVNQGFMGLQDKYGELRVTDTGIREMTILGQGLGAAMRGLRPLVEIQYLDYLLYALQIMSDDLATMYYRSYGGQKSPLIIRTRGHRLEGVWHSGSPMGMILHSLRGMFVCVPRNMVQAMGFYNTLLKSDAPALVVECLNGYRLKERMPDNFAEFTLPLGVPETILNGSDVTLVTYGSCVRIAQDAAKILAEAGISIELIDVQTLIPFDIHHTIVKSLKKTNRLVVLDEDVPGGASAYILQQILEDQNGYQYLDSKPKTIAAKEHRPAYATDGDYFSKPSVDDVVEAIYNLISESNPTQFPAL